MKASEMTNEELAECIESARLAPAKYILEDDLNFHCEAIREAAARLRQQDITIAAQKAKGAAEGYAHGCEETREKSSQVGNAAKMREALERILGTADHLQTRFAIPKLASEEISELKQIAESALSAPPRNCDVLEEFTADDEFEKAMGFPPSKTSEEREREMQ